MATGELAAVAPEGLVFRGALFVRAQKVSRQQPPGFCGDGAQVTLILSRAALRRLCGALGPSPLALHLRHVRAPAVVPQRHCGAELGGAKGARVAQPPIALMRVAPPPVPPDIFGCEAGEVAQGAEVRGPSVVHAQLVLPQLGGAPERLGAQVADATADSRLEGPRGAERTVGPRAPVL